MVTRVQIKGHFKLQNYKIFKKARVDYLIKLF